VNELLAALVQLGVLDNATAQRITRNLDPNAAQAWAESLLLESVTSGLDAQRYRLLELVDAGNGRPTAAQLAEFWRREDTAFFRSIEPALYEIAQERAIVSIVSGGAVDMWEAINEAVIGWVNDYYTNLDVEIVGSVPNINATSRTDFARAFLDWQRGELETAGYADGLPQLIRAIEPTFGAVRAERVAVTESTRIYYESTYQAANANPYIVALRWVTAADEIVCPICGPNHTVTVPKAQRVWPNGASIPAHPNCRCRAIEETALTLETPLPPEERYQWSADAYARYQQEQRNPSAAQDTRLLDALTQRRRIP
jgi:hypothetical protein